MKICFLITGLGIGGAEIHLLNLLPSLNCDKFIISLLDLNEIGEEFGKENIKVYFLGFKSHNLLSTILKFRKIIKKEKPDIIDSYLIHSNLFGRIFGKMFGVKKIISSIRSDYSDFKLLKFLDRTTQNLVDIFILNSNALLSYTYIKNHVPIKKIKIIPNMIDLEKLYGKLDGSFKIEKKLGLEKDKFIIISVARLIHDKNISTMIKAMKLVNQNITLLIIGEGPERGSLIRLMKKLKLTNIIFLGSRKDVLNFIKNSDIFILASIREGMSNALLEAMALKKICIVSDIPQNKELILDNVNGLTFNPKDETGLAYNIMKIYDNKQKFETLGKEAYKLINERFQFKSLIKKYENQIEILYIK